MKKLLSRWRVAIVLTLMLAWMAFSFWSADPIARADEPQKPALASGASIEFQEEIAPHFLRFGPSVRRGNGDVYGIYKFSPFRTVSYTGEVTNYVELHLGYGGGAMTTLTLDESSNLDEPTRAMLNGKLFTSADTYTTVIRFVLTKPQFESLDQFVSEMEGVMLLQPDPIVTYRFADGHWGDLHIRKDTTGAMSILVGKNEAGWDCWETIDSPSFRAAIKLTLKRLELLSSKPVSATITAN